MYLERATEGLHRHAPITTPGPLRADAVAAAPATQPAAQVATPSGQLPPADASAFLDDSDLDAFISEDMLGLDPDPTPEPQAIVVDMPDIPLPIDDAEAISDALSDFVSENLARVIAEKPAEGRPRSPTRGGSSIPRSLDSLCSSKSSTTSPGQPRSRYFT